MPLDQLTDVDQAVDAPNRPRRAPFSHLARRLLDVIMPPACLACHAPLIEHDALCAQCWREIHFIRAPLCDRLGLPLPFDPGGTTVSAAAIAKPPDFDRARAVALFSTVMRELIHQFKYADAHHARRLFGRWLIMAGHDVLTDCDLILPVPMHRRRLLARRFNQSALLAAEVARHANKPMRTGLLDRTKPTRTQVGLTTAQRHTNVAGAFKVTPRTAAVVRGCNILLIDDVITTGATLNACARALKRAGAERVDALALAIRPPGSTLVL